MATAKRTTSPAFQLYASDFISGDKVSRMSYTEIGIFIVLLCHAWMGHGLPTDVGEIAKKLRLNRTRFEKIWAGVLHECWIERGGKFVNPKQEDVRKKQNAFRQKQSDRASKGWQSRGINPAMPRHSHYEDRRLKTDLSLERKEERQDFAFAAFRDAYPRERRKGGYLVEQSFLAQVSAAGGSAALMAALENHKASEQWQTAKHIPGMDLWLSEERWRQSLPAAAAVKASNPWPNWKPRVGA